MYVKRIGKGFDREVSTQKCFVNISGHEGQITTSSIAWGYLGGEEEN
jgi:hypothetical protein